MGKFICMMLGLMVTGLAAARLPPLSEEAAAKAAEAKARAAWMSKVDAYKLCLSQDKVVARFQQEKSAAAQSSIATPACQDPGPYLASNAAVAPITTANPAGAAAAPKK